MWVFNITTNVDQKIESLWESWQKESNIPAMMATGCFRDFDFYRLIDDEQREGSTFIVQYYIDDISYYYNYTNQFAQSFTHAAINKWGNQMISFKTLMQTVQ